MDHRTSHGARLTAHGAVSTSLALRSDHELREFVEAGKPLGSGIGGTSALVDVDGTPVFVKQVPLTALEARAQNVRSTANLFGLPPFFHYGLGSPGFGAWRELAVHAMTTNWVLAREYEGFPLMHHWRVLPQPGRSLPVDLADVDAAVAFWGGGAGARRRIEALLSSTASVALFLEYIPQNLHDWFNAEVKAGDEAVERACAMVARRLRSGTSFVNARGLLHFDAHFQNILTDGRDLYFADYGLAVSSRFDLAEQEAGFVAEHQVYDRCYSLTHLVIWLISALYGYQGDELSAFLRACAAGERPTGIPPRAAQLIARHAPVAAVMTDFYRRLQHESLQTPFPLEEIRRAGGTKDGAVA